MNLNHFAAICRLGQKLENIDGPPGEARQKVLRDFIDSYEFPARILSDLKVLTAGLTDEESLALISELDKDDKLKVIYLFVNIVCGDGNLTEKGRDAVSEIVLACKLPVPGAEEQVVEIVETPPRFLLIKPGGYVLMVETESEDWDKLGKTIANCLEVQRVEVVRYTEPLNQLTRQLHLENYHLVFLTDAYGQTSGAGDNMPATLLYGGSWEIYGNIMIALETDQDYRIEGFHTENLFFEAFEAINTKVGNLLRVE